MEPELYHKKLDIENEMKYQEIIRAKSNVELCISIDFQGDLKEENFYNQLTYVVNASINSQFLEFKLSNLKNLFEAQKGRQSQPHSE